MQSLSTGQRGLLAVALTALPLTAALAQAPQGLSAEQIVRARQATYGLSAGTFGEMKMVVDGGGEVRPLVFGARMLQRWARTLPTMFPAGTDIPPTKAKAEVWSDRATFEQRAQAYAEAAARLAEVAQAGDRAAFATQWDAVRQTCSACHDRFRQEAQRPGS
jgi:cytochrome c556